MGVAVTAGRLTIISWAGAGVGPDAAARAAHVRGDLERLFREWTGRAALFGALVFLLIAPLDFVSAPALAPRFLAYRFAAAAGLLLLWRVARRSSTPFALRATLLAGTALSAGVIEVMILDHGGHRSAYAAGMILLAVTVLGFIPAGAGFHALVAALVYAIYLNARREEQVYRSEGVVKAWIYQVATCRLNEGCNLST